MKNVYLKFYGLGYNSSFQAFVRVYDNMNNLIYEGLTYDGILNIYLKIGATYKVVATFLNETLIKGLYINRNDTYIFMFEHSMLKNNSITFLLTDYYYNLPIERGELLLWQR